MKRKTTFACIIIMLTCVLLSACSSNSSSSQADHSGDPRDPTPKVLTPTADGTTVYQNDVASIDASHPDQGYVMVSYSGSCEKVKLQITGPDQNHYTYLISDRGNYNAFPLTAGNGSYSIQILENVGAIPMWFLLNKRLMYSWKMNFFHSYIQISMFISLLIPLP